MTNGTPVDSSSQPPSELLVGRRLRELRNQQRLSLRGLAERAGLNVNTLSLVENGKSSPSVSTLQQIALALKVPITTFFELQPTEKRVVFTLANQRPQVTVGRAVMENLGEDLAGHVVQPFLVTLQPGMGSGDRMIVHTGHEFVYCVNGCIHYRVEDADYQLTPGDSLVFEAHLPHCWENTGADTAQLILVLYPADERDKPDKHHLSASQSKKELTMKIAVITDDSKTISQHFGRAMYYLVVTIKEGKITARELRNKIGHNQFSAQPNAEENHGAEHGKDAASHNKHVSMAETIADCQVLLCGGMGMGAYDSMRRLNIKPIVTELREVEAAIQAYIDGKLVDHTELLH